MAQIVELEDVHKTYGSVVAVDGVSFEITKGEVFGLLGPNGAGKTTTVEMIEGLRKPLKAGVFVRRPASVKWKVLLDEGGKRVRNE